MSAHLPVLDDLPWVRPAQPMWLVGKEPRKPVFIGNLRSGGHKEGLLVLFCFLFFGLLFPKRRLM